MWETWVQSLRKEVGISDHLNCLLRNLYAGQEATVGTMDWFQIGKGVHQGCILSPCLFNLYAEYIMWNAGLDEVQLKSRFPGEISITSGMQMDLGKDMAIHSNNLPGKPPWTEEPGSLQSMGSQRVEHNWATEHAQHQYIKHITQSMKNSPEFQGVSEHFP